MSTFINKITTGSAYWWLMVIAGLGFESVALFYQYVLDYGPCPLCIHVRIGVLGFTLVSALALVIRNRFWWRISHSFNTIILLWLSERAYVLLGTERGFVLNECGTESGLPSWFPLDQWFPLLFKVHESCGYTPLMPLGISMAEALMVLYPLMLLLSLAMLIFSFSGNKKV